MTPTRHPLPLIDRQDTQNKLNVILASLTDVLHLVHYAHVNTSSPHFFQDHLLYDTIKGYLDPFIDRIAERVTALGGTADISLGQAAMNTKISKQDMSVTNRYLTQLADVLAQLSKWLYNCLPGLDKCTENIICELIEQTDKSLYHVEHHQIYTVGE